LNIGSYSTTRKRGFEVNCAPPNAFGGMVEHHFLKFLRQLHTEFTPRQQLLASERKRILAESLEGKKPAYPLPSAMTRDKWRIDLPGWCGDQRNQMTGPADDAELVVKMLNSGAPGVMLDLEDSMVNEWSHQRTAVDNILRALEGELSYYDEKTKTQVSIKSPSPVIWIRPRGLHMSQQGVLENDELLSASLFDLARIAFYLDAANLKHPLSIYIPKSESAEEALWWRDVFQALANALNWPKDFIKCMALVESHPLAFQMEKFLFNLKDHIVGLNLGRWDYMASLIHFHLDDPKWVLPDRNTIPHDVPFFQNLRRLMVEICHKRGVLAIGGMTALYPSRRDEALNARALEVLARDKKNEADCLMDGAWTGHPDQNQIAIAQFPYPNQINARVRGANPCPNLRPEMKGVGQRTLSGTRTAVRTVIRYRNGVLNGKGASLIDGYMEDLATDRIYRLMIAQRVKHSCEAPIVNEALAPVPHTPELITQLFDEELEKLISERDETHLSSTDTLREARHISESMIVNEEVTPV
jgi:malate synthase